MTTTTARATRQAQLEDMRAADRAARATSESEAS